MNYEDPELFIPRPGSVVWRVLDHLIANPNSELTRADVSAKFGCSMSGVDTMMQKPFSRGCLIKSRNSNNLLVWKLGMVKTFRLDPIPTDLHVPHEQPDAVIAKALPSSGKWTPTINTGPAQFPRAAAEIKARPPAIVAPKACEPVPAATEPVAPPAPKREDLKVTLVGQRILAMCPFKDTVIVATETGAFMYDNGAQEFRSIPFAAQ